MATMVLTTSTGMKVKDRNECEAADTAAYLLEEVRAAEFHCQAQTDGE